MDLTVPRLRSLRGTLRLPGDKSISHRALLLGSLCDGNVSVRGFLPSLDTLATLECLRRLGVRIDRKGPDGLVVHGSGAHGMREPGDVLDARNSGTTTRLLAGILAGQPFFSVLTGDESLRGRPMRRIVEPLRSMGADIRGRDADSLAPLAIRGGRLQGIDYTVPLSSAQVKSCVLLAGLFAEGGTTVREPAPTRDHTERMLAYLGGAIQAAPEMTQIQPSLPLVARPLHIPGDISSAAFPLAATALLPGSRLSITGVGLNPTRTAFLDVLERMGTAVEAHGVKETSGEPVGRLTARHAELRAVQVGGADIPGLIDELPILAALATQAEGTTLIRDAAELRVKESDRLHALAVGLARMGAKVEERPDGLAITGPSLLRGARLETYGDHRIAMAFYVAGLVAKGRTVLADAECIDVSFPGFDRSMKAVGRG
ncbi:MAG: 3-phosphoshikimate 1-carboxyvinyltransferase [Planctomycetes bacterium]|nr:3-phosphoshikimate 1-carboxyvinyltransferase [Planctomycetota bacterium]